MTKVLNQDEINELLGLNIEHNGTFIYDYPENYNTKVDKNIGIIGNGLEAFWIFQTLLNVKNLNKSKIFITEKIFNMNKLFFNKIVNFDKSKLTNELFFPNKLKPFIYDQDVKIHNYFDNLENKIKIFESVNILKYKKDHFKKMDLLFICTYKKNVTYDLIEKNIKYRKNDIQLIFLDNSLKFNYIKGIDEKIKVFKIDLHITPINQFGGRISFNKNVLEEDYYLLNYILETFGFIFNYNDDENGFDQEILYI